MKRFKTSLIYLIFLFSFSKSFAGSPYETSWAKDGSIMGTAAITGGGALLIKRTVLPITEGEILKLNRQDINAIDRSAADNYSQSLMMLSNIMLGFCVSMPVSLMAFEDIRKDAGKVGLMYLESWLFSVIAPYLAKGTVQRIRPFIYNPDVQIEEKLKWGQEAKLSFFSGHACVSFASAAFLSKVYSDYFPNNKYSPYLWTGSMLAAGFTAFLRYESGVHFPTDLLTGAIVGTVIGIAIPELHKVKNPNGNSKLDQEVYKKGFEIGFSVAL